MLNKYQKLSISVSVSICILLLNLAFAIEKDIIVRDTDADNSPQKMEKIGSSVNQHKFSWYVIAPGGGRSSSGSYTMKYNSVGQVFTDKAQGGNYKIFSGYLSTASYPYTKVKELNEDQVPYTFELFQNYPNPFNPTTNIRFNLPRSGHVRLDIYNILGRRVRTLVNEDLPAGHKLVTWDGTNDQGKEVASGVYFYRIQARDHTEAKKMLLLK
jgi:hypothetical protein